MTDAAPADDSSLSAKFIEKIETRLRDNKRVRYELPFGGRIHIDRQLPFLCVYRNPSVRHDDGTERLVVSQPSYILATGKQAFHDDLSCLVETVVRTLHPIFGAFWVLEIWTYHPNSENGTNEIPTLKVEQPAFEVRLPETPQSAVTLQSLRKNLTNIQVQKVKSDVNIVQGEKIAPPRLNPVLTDEQIEKLGCWLYGLNVRPIYRQDETGDLLPQVHRSFTRRFTTALQHIFYELAINHTSFHPKHYHFMGRRSVVKAVWEIDEQLAQVSRSYNFLLQVTPVNITDGWQQFLHSKFKKIPIFQYRPTPFEIALLKRELWNIRIEKLEDPVIESLFREKRREIDIELTMLIHRNSARFLYGGLQLYGDPSPELVQASRRLISKIRSLPEPQTYHSLTADEFSQYAEQEIEYYRQQYPELKSSVTVRDDVATMMVSNGDLLIGSSYMIPEDRINALLQHEVGTHILTTYNGRSQRLQQLSIGLAGYQPLQEGLAVLTEYLVDGLNLDRLALLAGRVLAVKMMVNGADFVETFHELVKNYGFDEETAYMMTMRVHRGGGFAKDAVYLGGLISVLDYIAHRGDLQPLFFGKIAARHIPIIQELRRRGVLQPPPLQPHYLSMPSAQERLSKLRNKHTTVFDLI